MPAARLLRVTHSYRLPGLGLLAIGQTEPRLRELALHTKLAVELRFPGGARQTVPASVEEMTQAGSLESAERTDYVLLLEAELVAELPPGTEIWGD